MARRWGSAFLVGLFIFSTFSRGIPLAHATGNSIVLLSAELELTLDADANNIANIGDTVRVVVDLDNPEDNPTSCGTTTTVVTADMRAYGGSSALNIPCFGGDGANNLAFSRFLVISDGGLSGIDVGADDDASAVSVHASDSNDSTSTIGTNNLGDGVIDTAATGGVDTIRPVVTDASIAIQPQISTKMPRHHQRQHRLAKAECCASPRDR